MAALSDDDLRAMLTAATQAAQSASDAAQALQNAQSQRGTGVAGMDSFKEASRMVRQPDPFGSEDHESDLSKWQDFCVNLKAWLFLGNPGFEQDLIRAEAHRLNVIDVSAEPADVQNRCKQFYNIMTGLLKGKPLRLLRQIENRNGYELWRQLCQLFAPKTRARSISVLSALLQAPHFTKDRTLLDQVLGLERLRAEYAKSSGTDVSNDLMLSVLVRSLPRHIQQHVQLQMDETSAYEDIRSLVVGYEKVTTSWSPNKIHNELGIVSPPPASNPSGPAPMEVDLVTGNPKGKAKGKGKYGNPQNPKGKEKRKGNNLRKVAKDFQEKMARARARMPMLRLRRPSYAITVASQGT